MGIAYDLVAFLVVFLYLGCLSIIVLEMKRQRCPSCGKVLRFVSEVDKYKCMRCGTWYPREDIETEGFD